MAKQICSKCGYEGRGRRIGERRGGGAARVLGMLLLLPIYTLWKATGSKAGKQCPHCGLPTMVKLNSDAGRLAQHMLEVELGFIKPKTEEKQPLDTFGNDRPAEQMVTKRSVDPEQW